LSATKASEQRFWRPCSRPVAECERIWLVTTNDNLDALRFYQRRGFVLSALRAGAVADSRQRLKPQIASVGDFGIPLRDELELRLLTNPPAEQ
jgi:hypothetical protein